MKIFVTLLLGLGAVQGQFGVPPFSWGGGNRPGPGPGPNPYGKPLGRPGGPPTGYSRPLLDGGPPGGYPSRGDGPVGNPYSDDPIPPHPESSYDPQRLPSKLPIEAPNGVVEIYNRVVDDLIGILKDDFKKRDLDPMPVVIRATPPGPVRVPGYLQKRPFRRPGAALYRSSASHSSLDTLKLPSPAQKLTGTKIKRNKRYALSLSEEGSRFGENRPSIDGGNRAIEPTSTTTTSTAAPEVSSSTVAQPSDDGGAAQDEGENLNVSASQEKSSEEDAFMKARSDEFFPDTEDEEVESRERKGSSKKKGSESEEDPEDDGHMEDEKDVENLMQLYHNQNSKDKGKYAGKNKKKDKNSNKPVVVDPADSEEQEQGEGEGDAESEVEAGEGGQEAEGEEQVMKEKEVIQKKNSDGGSGEKALKSGIIQSEENEDDEDDDEDPEGRDDQPEDEFSAEPGTGGGQRPNGGYYPSGGPPAVPAKPNAQLTGLSNIKRVTDVQVSVDARSAVITSRLLVGPIEVVINDSSEPMEKNVKARIPELEAELLLMERHGVVFLQRFTLDRAYGQDVEISVPKSKKEKKKSPAGLPPPQDPNHPINVEARRQTKMAAHISMEVVKLLRSGNLRANLMRTAMSAMSKLKLPIKKSKTNKNKNKSKKESKDKEHKKESGTVTKS